MLSNQAVKAYAEWLDGMCRWQILATLRLPPRTSPDALRQLVQRGLIRPLAKFTRQQIFAAGAFVERPNHCHLLLQGTKTDLSFLVQEDTAELLRSLTDQRRDPILFRGSALRLRPVYSTGATCYTARNLLDKHGPTCSDLWIFNRALLDKARPDPKPIF